jgi:hypothetical protein
MKLSICSPVGGFGNHLRWLLLLSPEFNIEIMKINNKKFILNSLIYNKHRTCFNWIHTEWKYRKSLRNHIDFDHNIENVYDATTTNKIVVMTVKPKYALKHYLKFNPLINDHTIKSFLKHVAKDNKCNTEFRVIQNGKTLVIDANKLYNAVLDKELYESTVNFFEIGNVYEQANDVHKLWYELNQQANKDVLDTANEWKYSANIKKPEGNIYNKTIETILTLYKNEHTILHGS